MPKKEKFDWEDLLRNPDKYAEENRDWSDVDFFPTPDWVRHPERYPERWKRLEELGEEFRELLNGKNGGADGTRTRDPRRDRPVF